MIHKVIFCVLVIYLISSSASAATAAEAEALVRWKSSLSASEPLVSWRLDDEQNICNWTGILCDNLDSITSINLTNAGVDGALTGFSFNAFRNLTSLDLSFNSLTGQIPSSIGNLSKLTHLDLNTNLFDGFIPREIGLLSELEFLACTITTLAAESQMTLGI